MTDEEIKTANKTARSVGAVGSNALLPRIITGRYPCLSAKILDFGSGPRIVQTINLKDLGYTHVDPYEFGSNRSEVHIDRTPDKINSYDIVMASNVINTLSSIDAVKETLHQINWFLNCKGVALINFPAKPRKCKELDQEKLTKLLTTEFKEVMVENHSGTRVFYCYRMSQADWDVEEANDPRLKELEL